jgi:parvulin-like peptidyl-prolyl isomerase
VKLSTQAAVVICVGIVSVIAAVVCLAVFAKMDSGALVGLAVGSGAVLGNLVAQLRTNSKLVEQDKTLDTIKAQTNGLSDGERQDIASRAVDEVVARLKSEGHL